LRSCGLPPLELTAERTTGTAPAAAVVAVVAPVVVAPGAKAAPVKVVVVLVAGLRTQDDATLWLAADQHDEVRGLAGFLVRRLVGDDQRGARQNQLGDLLHGLLRDLDPAERRLGGIDVRRDTLNDGVARALVHAAALLR